MAGATYEMTREPAFLVYSRSTGKSSFMPNHRLIYFRTHTSTRRYVILLFFLPGVSTSRASEAANLSHAHSPQRQGGRVVKNATLLARHASLERRNKHSCKRQDRTSNREMSHSTFQKLDSPAQERHPASQAVVTYRMVSYTERTCDPRRKKKKKKRDTRKKLSRNTSNKHTLGKKNSK